MVSRTVRAAIVVVATLAILAGCGDFSLSSLLDTPPDGPGGQRLLSIAPDTVNAVTGTNIQFTATGGLGSYSWSADGGSITLTGVYSVPAAVGTYTVTVTDAEGASQDATVVASSLIPLTISPTSITIDAGGAAVFTGNGGSGNPLNYAWAVIAGGGSMAGSTYTADWAAGPATVRLTDTLTTEVRTAVVTVRAPAAVTIAPTVAAINAGDSIAFTAAGGSGSYSWSETGLGSLAGSTYASTGAAESATIRVDDLVVPGAFAEATVTVTVPLVLSISPSSVTLNAGDSISFTADAGTPPYSYAVVSGGGTLAGALYTAPWSATTAVIRVTDALFAASDATVTVNPPPPLTLSPAAVNVLAGSPVTFTPGGGSGSYSFSVVTGTGSLVGPTYTTTAAEASVVRLTDTITGSTLDASVTSYYPLTIFPTTLSIQAGESYPFASSGGVPGYTYAVVEGAPGGSVDAAGLYTAPGAPGTFHVLVTDSIANESTATVTVTVPLTWDIVSIDQGSKSGQYASLALDSAGLPRIAYYEGIKKELRFTGSDGSTWSTVTVDSDKTVGTHASLALLPGGDPRIAYYDVSDKNLRFASRSGPTWGAAEIVDSAGDVGEYASLALEPGTGHPRIAYSDATSSDLTYAAWNGSSWSIQAVDSAGDVGQYASLALEPGTNRPRIAYYDATNRDLKYAAWDGSAWQVSTADNSLDDVGQYASLALEPGTNDPRIAYYDATGKDLKLATWTAGWIIETVDDAGDVGKHASLRLHPVSKKPRIAYYNATALDLKYAEKL